MITASATASSDQPAKESTKASGKTNNKKKKRQSTEFKMLESDSKEILGRIAARVGATPGQVALAWLLQRSPVMLPIPGTGSLSHLEENCASALLTLDPETVSELDRLATG